MLFLFLHFLGCESLEALLAENSQYVAKLSQLVLHETDREKSRVYANLILTQGYIKGVIKEMIEEGSFLLQSKSKSTYWKDGIKFCNEIILLIPCRHHIMR